MLSEALAAYAHFLAIFALVALLVAEAALYAPRLSAATLALLRRLDLGYLLAAIAVLVTGALRLLFFAKGPAFYAENPVFWVKMALFLAIGVLSIPPTLHFIRSAKAAGADEIVIEPSTYRHIRGHLTLELALVALVPLAAALMARGIGL